MKITIEQLAEGINIPVQNWPRNCFAIASKIVDRKLLGGTAVYGMYRGRIDDGCSFASRPFTHHGWIEQADQIVDVLRWYFEHVTPYVFTGPLEHPDYDFGSNQTRASFLMPAPVFNATQASFTVPLALQPFVCSMLGDARTKICMQQIGWLASLPLQLLGQYDDDIYAWVCDDVGVRALIPHDNYHRYLRRKENKRGRIS